MGVVNVHLERQEADFHFKATNAEGLSIDIDDGTAYGIADFGGSERAFLWNPIWGDAAMLLAQMVQMQTQSGRPADGARTLEELRRLYPDDIQTRLLVARRALRDDDPREAFDAIEKIATETDSLIADSGAQAPSVETADAGEPRWLWQIPSSIPKARRPKAFVDFQNDTTADDLHLAVREGYHSIEHVKRYTALGFGTDQGKLGNINGMAILADALGQTIPETGQPDRMEVFRWETMTTAMAN